MKRFDFLTPGRPTRAERIAHALWPLCALIALGGCARVIGLGSGYYIDEGGSSGDSVGGGNVAGGPSDIGGSSGSGGNAGTGGMGSSSAGGGDAGAATLCEQFAIPARAGWVPSASSQAASDPPANLTDGTAYRWSTGKPQSGDEWLQIDFGARVAIRSVNLQQGADPNDYPREYALIISDVSGDLMGKALFEGEGTSGVSTTTVLSTPHVGRYLLIKQLGVSVSWWSVDELEVGCIDD